MCDGKRLAMNISQGLGGIMFPRTSIGQGYYNRLGQDNHLGIAFIFSPFPPEITVVTSFWHEKNVV